MTDQKFLVGVVEGLYFVHDLENFCHFFRADSDSPIFPIFSGFYGRPWTPMQRKELFFKMKKLRMDSYVYAPKVGIFDVASASFLVLRTSLCPF